MGLCDSKADEKYRRQVIPDKVKSSGIKKKKR